MAKAKKQIDTVDTEVIDTEETTQEETPVVNTEPSSEGETNTEETTDVVDTELVNTTEATQEETALIDEDEILIKRYKKLYPQNKVFHLTSDKQVFLENGKHDALRHEKTIGDGSIKSYHQHTI